MLEMQGKVGKGTYYVPKWLVKVSQGEEILL